MNNYSPPKPALTSEQRALIDQFNTAIEHSDETTLEGIMTRLDSIPDEVSPIRQLINRDSSASIKVFLKTAKKLIALAMNKEFQKQLESYSLRWQWHLNDFQAGKSSDLHIEPFTFDVSIQNKTSYSSVAKNIYRNAIWAYAFKGESNKVGELLNSYATFSAEHPELVYMHAISGYFQGGFYQKIPSTMLDELFVYSLKCRKRKLEGAFNRRADFSYSYATREELTQEKSSQEVATSFENILQCYYDAGLHEELTALCRKYITRLEKMNDLDTCFSLYTLYKSTAYYAHPVYVFAINTLLKLHKLELVLVSLPTADYFKDKDDGAYRDEYEALKKIYENIFQYCLENNKKDVIEKLCIKFVMSTDASRKANHYGTLHTAYYTHSLYIFAINTLLKLQKLELVLVSLPTTDYLKNKDNDAYKDEYESLKKIYENIFQYCLRNDKKDVIEKLCIQYGMSADARRKVYYYGTLHLDPLYIFIIQTLAQLGKVDVVSYFLMQEKHYTPTYYSSYFLFYYNEYLIKTYPAAIAGYQSGGFDLEASKLRKVASILKDALAVKNTEKSEKIFETINTVEDVELKKALFIDCIHKRSFLGLIMWAKYNYGDSTPSLKRKGTLQKVVHALIDLKVDVAKIPGCEEFAPKTIGWGYNYPSKKRGLAPFHQFAPKVDAQVSMTIQTESKDKEDHTIQKTDNKPTSSSSISATHYHDNNL